MHASTPVPITYLDTSNHRDSWCSRVRTLFARTRTQARNGAREHALLHASVLVFSSRNQEVTEETAGGGQEGVQGTKEESKELMKRDEKGRL
eukprot:6192604-Pleurochrysis_carterae.AAC.6